MAHPQQLQFIDAVSKHLAKNYHGKLILEIGSYDVNGTVRSYFTNSTYIGVDLIKGPGVDIVSDGENLDHPDETYDITISCECFEHNPHWVKTLVNMIRMTKPGGIVIVTCATTGRLEHGTTRTSPNCDGSPGSQTLGWEYYLNLTEADFKRNIDLGNTFESYFFVNNKFSHDLYFVGMKKGASTKFEFDNVLLKTECIENAERNSVNSNYPKNLLMLHKLSMLPLHIFIGLPENQFQNIAFYYSKFLRLFTSPIKKLFRKFE